MQLEIVEYDLEWPALFRARAERLRGALGDVALRIDHIGSTAVPGLAAKTIIDIQISVAAFEPFDCLLKPMTELGYVFRADNPDRTKRYFRETPGARREHVHVRKAGSWSEQLALLFRDYMRTHRADAARYAELKRRLADQYRDDRDAYTEAKQPFIWQVMQVASDWSQETGWEPGPTDC